MFNGKIIVSVVAMSVFQLVVGCQATSCIAADFATGQTKWTIFMTETGITSPIVAGIGGANRNMILGGLTTDKKIAMYLGEDASTKSTLDLVYSLNRTLVAVAGVEGRLDYGVALTDQDVILFRATTTDCHPNCQTCVAGMPKNCTTCKSGYQLQSPPTSGMCNQISCDSSCQTCVGTQDTQCSSCKEGYSLSPSAGPGKCQQIQCFSSCLTCVGVQASQCKSCQSGFTLTSANA